MPSVHSPSGLGASEGRLANLASLLGEQFYVNGARDVATLLWSLHCQAFSGVASFSKSNVIKKLVFKNGNLVFASSSSSADRMASQLFREGRITKEQRQKSAALAEDRDIRMGEALLECEALNPEELPNAVRRHIAWIVYSVFFWNRSSVTVAFLRARKTVSDRVRRLPMSSIIFEGIRSVKCA